MKLRVVSVEPNPADHNRSVIVIEAEANPISVQQGFAMPGEELTATRRGTTLLAEVHVQPRHDDLPPGHKRTVNTAKSILDSADDTR